MGQNHSSSSGSPKYRTALYFAKSRWDSGYYNKYLEASRTDDPVAMGTLLVDFFRDIGSLFPAMTLEERGMLSYEARRRTDGYGESFLQEVSGDDAMNILLEGKEDEVEEIIDLTPKEPQ